MQGPLIHSTKFDLKTELDFTFSVSIPLSKKLALHPNIIGVHSVPVIWSSDIWSFRVYGQFLGGPNFPIYYKIDHISRIWPEFWLYGHFLAGPTVDHTQCTLQPRCIVIRSWLTLWKLVKHATKHLGQGSLLQPVNLAEGCCMPMCASTV